MLFFVLFCVDFPCYEGGDKAHVEIWFLIGQMAGTGPDTTSRSKSSKERERERERTTPATTPAKEQASKQARKEGSKV